MKLWKNRSAKVKSQWTDCCFDRHMCCICNVFSFTAFLPFFSCFPLFSSLWPCLHPLPSPLLRSTPASVAVDTSLLQWSLDCGTIPLVCPVGRDGRGCSVMLDPTEVTAAISRALQPHKVMFLNNSGGLRSQERKAWQMVLSALIYNMRCQVCKSDRLQM